MLQTLAPPGHGYAYCGGHGAGHFVKMVHNGIEYGMMQAYAEGFELLEATRVRPRPRLDRGPVEPGQRGPHLAARARRATRSRRTPASSTSRGYVEDTGEGRWTVEEAIDHSVPLPVITLVALHALPLAPGRLVRRQGARRAAQRVRRPRGQGEGVTQEHDPGGHLTSDEPEYGESGVTVTGRATAEGASPFGGDRTRTRAAWSSSAPPATSRTASSSRRSTTSAATAAAVRHDPGRASAARS